MSSNPSVVAAGAPELGRTLKSRHVAMITFGGIIGAGLFVGSSTAIGAIGPAAVIIYLVIALAQLRLRAGFEASAPERRQVRMWLCRYGTYARMAGMIGVLLLMALPPTHAIELWASVLVTAVCLAGYWLRMRFGRGIAA